MSKTLIVSALMLTLLVGCGSKTPTSSDSLEPSTPNSPASSTPPTVGHEGRATKGALLYAKKDDLNETLSSTASGGDAAQLVAADIADGKAAILDEGTRVAVREIQGLFLRAEPLEGQRQGTAGWMLALTVAGTGATAPAGAQPPPTPAPSPTPSPTPAAVPAKFSMLTVDSAVMEGGRVIVTGSTDLPDGAKINVDFNVARRNPKDSYVGVSDDVLAKGGKYRAELIPPDHPDLATGPNEVEVLFTPRAQEPNILRIVGEDGQRLTCPSSDDSLGFTLLETTKRVPILLTKKSYPMVTPTSYSRGTAERTVADYLASWKAKNWNAMVMSTQLTWRETTDNPVRSLQNQYDMRELIGAEITGRSEVSAAMVDIGVRITYSIGSEVDSRETSYRVIREIGAYEPSADRGTWGVNPISAM